MPISFEPFFSPCGLEFAQEVSHLEVDLGDLVGLGGDRELGQESGFGVESGVPELFGVHFAQALEATDVEADSRVFGEFLLLLGELLLVHDVEFSRDGF